MIPRREFITLFGGAAAAWPLAASAQQPDRIRRIGVFAFGAESDPAAQAYVRALRQGLVAMTRTPLLMHTDFFGGGAAGLGSPPLMTPDAERPHSIAPIAKATT